jgi:hypothetical protein
MQTSNNLYFYFAINRTTIFPNGSLTINSVEKDDSGIYRCVAIPLVKDSLTQTYSTRLQIACKN